MHHPPTVQCFDVRQEADQEEDVVVTRERREPSNGEIANPNDEDERIDGEKGDEDEQNREGGVIAGPKASC
jgi:hypothetical protein